MTNEIAYRIRINLLDENFSVRRTALGLETECFENRCNLQISYSLKKRLERTPIQSFWEEPILDIVSMLSTDLIRSNIQYRFGR